MEEISEKGSGCDPACGEGVFLLSMLKGGFKEVVGVDVDEVALNRASELMPPEAEGRVKLFRGNALLRQPTLTDKPLLPENYFDFVCGNPPFSAKYGRIRDLGILSQYSLGLGRSTQAVEVLFLERFIRLAKKGGVVAIILPDGVFLNINYREVREFILRESRVFAVISLPRGIFGGGLSTTSKTSVLFAIKGERHYGEVFMAEAKSLEELPAILEMYREGSPDGVCSVWAKVSVDALHPKIHLGRTALLFKHPTYPLGELVEEIVTGATEYGEKRKFSERGLRFISAKVVTPLGLDFRKDLKFIEPGSAMDKKRAHVKVGDVVFVRVGVGTIGRTAVITDEEDVGVADDWIYIIRVKQTKVSPFYLAAFLQSKPAKLQIEKLRRGVGTVTIPKSLLAKILVPTPSPDFQAKIETTYREMVKLMREGKYEEAWKKHDALIKAVEHEIT